MNNLIGTEIVVRNDRGAQYRGILKALLLNGDIMLEVHAICLSGRLTDGDWHTLRRVEVQRITGPVLEDNDETEKET